MSSVISVKKLTKQYLKTEKRAVDDISFEVEEGSLFAFLGPNGAGKTTTISILTTTLNMTEGEVSVAGFDLKKQRNKIRQEIGIIFQKPSLDENLTAEENIRLHAGMYNVHSFRPFYALMDNTYKEKINELAEIIGIQEQINDPVKTFSGGMKRKLEIVRTLIHNPKILFLDEPTTGLSPEARQNLWSYLKKTQKETGMTIFLTTHYLEEAETADNVVIISKGKITAEGTPTELKEKLVSEHLIMKTENTAKLKDELINKHKISKERIKSEAKNIIKLDLVQEDNIQELLSNLNTKISWIDVNRPTLEEAYLKVIEEKEEEEEEEEK